MTIDGENTQQARDAQRGNRQVHPETSSKLAGVSDPSKQHVTHLLAAERELLSECHRHRIYLAMCGEVLPVAELSTGLCEPGCERMVTYCEDCLHDAARCNADAGLVWSPPGTSFEIDPREGW